MAAVSNYSLRPRGPQWLIYSEALGGAVRRRTPSLPLCWLTVLDGSQLRILNTHTGQYRVFFLGVFLYTIQHFLQLIVSEGEVIFKPAGFEVSAIKR